MSTFTNQGGRRRSYDQSKPPTIAVFSDPHSGHSLGLMSPETVLYQLDGETGQYIPYHPQLTNTQRLLWAFFSEDVTEVVRFADGGPIMVLHLGDATHGNKYIAELVSNVQSNQILIALWTMREWMQYQNVVGFRLAVGTESHAFGLHSSDFMLVELLRAFYPSADIELIRHGVLETCGIRVDYAHHGPGTGIRQWTRGNVARWYLTSRMIESLGRDECPPALYVRGHVHDYVYEIVRVGNYRSAIAVLPSYSGLIPHAQQVTRSVDSIRHGMIAVRIESGRIVDMLDRIHTVDLRRKETWDPNSQTTQRWTGSIAPASDS